jgi:ABC-type Fe3+/spermidine/putrescine transport system ATPase subunit
LLDEPFSNLDAVHKNIIKSVIEDIGKRLNITCMMVSHDAPDILSWADKILILKDGLLVQQGSPEEIYRQPVNEYCAGLFGAYNLFHIKGKNILIRPEQINIVSKGNHLIKGVVRQVLFFGSHYSIDVMVDDELLSVKTGSRGFNTGEDIYLSFKEDDWWYI